MVYYWCGYNVQSLMYYTLFSGDGVGSNTSDSTSCKDSTFVASIADSSNGTSFASGALFFI